MISKNGFLTLILLFVWLLAACQPEGASGPEAIELPEEQVQAVQDAQADLAERLNISADSIQVVRVEDMEWPNACLGLAQEGEACAEVVTPGYQIALDVNGEQYVYRTDQTGEILRLAEGGE